MHQLDTAISEPCFGRSNFPLLRNNPVIYLDSAATTQKPDCVLLSMDTCYRHSYANIHRGVYQLSVQATAAYEAAREGVRCFINARLAEEIIFTRGATEGINLVAYSWGEHCLKEGQEIIVTQLEHHANFVPWQLLAQRKQAKVIYPDLNADGSFCWESFQNALSERTALVAVTMLSNSIGVKTPIADIIEAAHQVGALVLVDAAQAIARWPIDVSALGCDYLVFSGHKAYGPTGIGVLYGRRRRLLELPPFLSGGDMIRSVSTTETTFNTLPYRFEAGTPPIVEAIGLHSALDYLAALGWDAILKHEAELSTLLTQKLSAIPELYVLGPAGAQRGVVSFIVDGIHPHDLAQLLDSAGVAIRAGHHCAQPLLNFLGLSATARASIGIYNTAQDIDRLSQGLRQAIKFFSSPRKDK